MEFCRHPGDRPDNPVVAALRRSIPGAGLLGLAMLALAACSSGGPVDEEAAEVDPATLCVASDCGSKLKLLDIPSAENIFFTDDGRLFVTGDNIYEISREGEAWKATPLSADDRGFTGMAQIGSVLYANSFDGALFAGRLTARPSMEPIHSWGQGQANGLAAGPDGELYSVVSIGLGLPPNGKILRLRLDPHDPFRVVEQSDWLTGGIVRILNGLQRRGSTLLFSASEVLPPALGKIMGVEILADGSAGEPELLASFLGIPDDFSVVGDALLAAVYSNNQILLIGADGRILSRTQPLSFDNPSQVRLGRPPLFARDEILVTEKGLIGVPTIPGYGNRLSLFRPDREHEQPLPMN